MNVHSSRQHIYDYYIDEQGNWFCEGNAVLDPQLFMVLSRSLFESENRYFIRCEGEVHPVRVADAPLWIRYVHPQCDSYGNLENVEIELQDGRREPLKAETLTVARDEALYCQATPRRMKARFGKIAYYEFTHYLQADTIDEGFYFLIGGRRYDIRPESAEV